MAEALLERGLRAGDLRAGGGLVECEQVGVGDGVRSEAQRAGAVERAHLVPLEQWRLGRVPGQGGAAVDDARGQEDRRAEAMALEHRHGAARDVGVAVVEAQPDAALRPALGEQREALLDVDRPQAVASEAGLCAAKRAGVTASSSRSSLTRW